MTSKNKLAVVIFFLGILWISINLSLTLADKGK